MTDITIVDTHQQPIPITRGIPSPASPVWVTVRPGVRRGATVAADLLSSLGKNMTWHGKGRNEAEDIHLAIAWIRAMRVTGIVIVNAQEAPLPTLDALRNIAHQSDADLWLLHRAPTDDRTFRKITKMATRTLSLDQVPSPLPLPQPASPQRSTVPTMPGNNFATFHAALLADVAAEPALALYLDQVSATQAIIDSAVPARDAILSGAHLILRDAPDDGELIARMHALQVLAWRHDLFLDVDLDTLLPSVERPRHSSSALDAALLAYRQPQRAIVAALTLRGIPLNTIDALTIGDTDTSGNVTPLAHEVHLTDALRTAIRAQRHLRTLQDAATTDRLLLPDAKTLARFVNDATADLGITMAGRRVERALTTRAWLKRLGITLRSM